MLRRDLGCTTRVRAEAIALLVQVNWKLRDRIKIPVDIAEEEARDLALSSVRVRPHVEGRELKKSVYVPGDPVNLVGASGLTCVSLIPPAST
jgi:leucyl-tRNA synthetase